MHFALPPRKTSRPPPYTAARSSYSFSPYFYLRRSRLRSLAGIFFGVVLLVLLLSRVFGRGGVSNRIPPGTPSIVLVTVLDRAVYSPDYQRIITENRRDYAERHGYATFLANASDYDLSDPPVPTSWAKIPALRHAMTLFPHSTYFFYLSPHALIMRPSLSLTTHILSPPRLESLLIPDKPVVPPDSVIRTFHHRRADQIDLILTQDHEGLSQGSLLLRAGDWARFFLDAWFDPLYRSYNFQRAEGHALEHLVQWHGSVLSRLGLVPQGVMNSYTQGLELERYVEGDFVAHMYGCDAVEGRSCEGELLALYEERRKAAMEG